MKFLNRKLFLILILLFAFITRAYRLHLPEKYIFDEVYHVVTAKLIAANDPRAFEWWNSPVEPNTAVDWLHPPLAKYTQGFFIKTLGSSSFSWRISSALFGVGVIYLVYLLARELFRDQRVSLLAAGLAALDGLLLVQSRIAMNDIHVTFFILLTLTLYLKYLNLKQQKYLWLTGLAAGLAMSSKWSGMFAVGIVGISEVIRVIKKNWQNKDKYKKITKEGLRLFFIMGIIPAIIYILSYGQMFLQGKGLDHFYKLHQQIWWYQTSLDATHPYQSRPLEWFLDLKPVWIHVDYIDQNTIANIYTFGNPILFWMGAVAVIWTTLHAMLIKFSSKNKFIDQKLAGLLFAYFMVWLPWQLSPRIMFFYHYTPAVPLMCIILAFWLTKLWSIKATKKIRWGRIVVALAITLIAASFIIWYPHWTGIPVSKVFADNIYYMIPGWK